jgi:uncharacterized protein (DUF2235 family)
VNGTKHMSAAADGVKKRIAVCCDGTGNEIDENNENISNVLKFFRCLRKTSSTPGQIVFYDPGVGTLARPNPWRKMWQDAFAIFGLLTAYGLDDNVLSAYEFLLENYGDGDEIFLFGFSRGAHTVRILAALIHEIGLLEKSQRNLTGIGLNAYKQFSASQQDIDQFKSGGPAVTNDQAAHFGRVVSSRWPIIRMVGVWDTVASVIIPRRDRLYFPSLEGNLAYTRQNPSVKTFRQAISIDECRRMYRLNTWSEPQTFLRNRFSSITNDEPQDIMQVWFTGVHADVGGGYRERESALSKFPLLWMIDEALKCGLAFDRRYVNMLAWGIPRKGGAYSYSVPDVRGELHNSMSVAWRALEYFPKRRKYKEWPKRQSRLGFYIPNGEPRLIPEDSLLHESVVERMQAIPTYRPTNLPSRYRTVAMTSPLWVEP